MMNKYVSKKVYDFFSSFCVEIFTYLHVHQSLRIAHEHKYMYIAYKYVKIVN